MERVAFLIEHTGELLRCLMNPEGLQIQRRAGIRQRRSVSGRLSQAGLSDDPLICTGGGRTEMKLDLLFDVDLAGSSIATDDVRELTGPLWDLSENWTEAELAGHPPVARFMWGKSKGWNIPGVIVAVSENLQRFSGGGVPRRSWLRMMFRRVPDEQFRAGHRRQVTWSYPSETAPPPETGATRLSEIEEATGTVHQATAGERLDSVASQYYGNPSLWRLLASYNDIDDPMDLPAGALIRIPDLDVLRSWL